MVRSHSPPLHGLRTSRYRGGSAVCLLSGRLGISPNITSSVVKFLCHASPVLRRFRVNGSHLSHHGGSPSLWNNDTSPHYLPPFLLLLNTIQRGVLFDILRHNILPLVLNISPILQKRRYHESKTTPLVGSWWSILFVLYWFRACYVPLWLVKYRLLEQVLVGLVTIADYTARACSHCVGVPACQQPH